MNLRRRLEDLERRPGTPRQQPASEGRRRVRDLLDRYAAAKRSGALTDELQKEMEQAVAAIRGRLDTGYRGEGGR